MGCGSSSAGDAAPVAPSDPGPKTVGASGGTGGDAAQGDATPQTQKGGMFRFFAGANEQKERLDQIEMAISDCGDKPLDEACDILAHAAKTAKDVMQLEVAHGSSNLALMKQIDRVSESILRAVEVRLTPELLQSEAGKTNYEQLYAVAKDLNAVRATKATDIVQSKYEAMQETAAQPHATKAIQALSKVANPAALVGAATEVLNHAEVCQRTAPKSKSYSDALLRRALIPLTAKLVDDELLPGAVKLNPHSIVSSLPNLAGRLDSLATKLTAVHDAKWDPPSQPKVEAALKRLMEGPFAEHTKSMKDMLDAAPDSLDLELVMNAVRTLAPLWPFHADQLRIGSELTDLCAAIDERAVARFSAGQDQQKLLKFAMDYDTVCAKYVGCPIADTSLRTSMRAAGAEGVNELLSSMEAEMGKDESDAAGLKLLEKSLEELAKSWKGAVALEASLAERLAPLLASIEGRVQQMSATEAVVEGNGQSVLQFAARYDKYRTDLSPPQPAGGKILPDVAKQVTGNLLTSLEREVESFSNPSGLMGAIGKFKLPPVKEVLKQQEEAARRLCTALERTERRFLERFWEAREIGDSATLEIYKEKLVKHWDSLRPATDPWCDKERAPMSLAFEIIEQLLLMEVELNRESIDELDVAAVTGALSVLPEKLQRETNPKAHAKSLFAQIDTNGDGKLDQGELFSFLDSCSEEEWREDAAAELLSGKDGFSLEEFQAWIQSTDNSQGMFLAAASRLRQAGYDRTASRLKLSLQQLKTVLLSKLARGNAANAALVVACAQAADAVSGSFTGKPCSELTNVVASLKPASEAFAVLEEALGVEGNVDNAAVKNALKGLRACSSAMNDVPEYRDRLLADFAKLQLKVNSGVQGAAASKDGKALDETHLFARELDDAFLALNVDAKLAKPAAEAYVKIQLDRAEQALGNTPMDPRVLIKAVKALASKWSDVDLLGDTGSVLLERMAGLEATIAERMDKAYGAAKEASAEKKLELLTVFQTEFDSYMKSMSMEKLLTDLAPSLNKG